MDISASRRGQTFARLIIRLLHREVHVLATQVHNREAGVVDPAGEVAIQNLGDAVPGDQGHGAL